MSGKQHLHDAKYAELQKLAKDAGIKANMKSEKLIKALEEHYKKNEGHQTNMTKLDISSTSDHSSVDKVLTPNENNAKSSSSSPVVLSDSPKKVVPKQPKRRGRKAGKGQKTMKKSVHVERGKRRMSESDSEEKHSEEKSDASEVQPSKRRRSTFEVMPSPKPADNEPKKDSIDISVMDAMKPEMNSSDMKESLMAAIDKKVQKKMTEESGKEGTSTTTTSQIPRFAAFLAKKKAEKTAVTPGNKNWTKIHEKHFSKMDSIDVYLAKKRKRTQSFSNCLKRAKEAATRTREAMNKLSHHKTPDVIKRKRPVMPFKSPVGSKVASFKPSVTSTKNANFNFGKSVKTPVFGERTATVTKSNTGQKPTAVRRSPRNAENNNTMVTSNDKVNPSEKHKTINNRKSLSNLNNTLQPDRRKSCVTPFKPMNVTLDINQSTKKAFDLQASLSKPLSWKPYTGKLKSLEPKLSNPVHRNFKNTSIKSAPQKHSRAQRLADMKERHADKKFSEQMKRRGMVA